MSEETIQVSIDRLRAAGAKGGKAGKGASKRRSAAFYRRISALGVAARMKRQGEAK